MDSSRIQQQLERAQREARTLAEMAGMAGSEAEYTNTVDAVLRLVEKLVVSPLLCLSIHERAAVVGHYARTAGGIDAQWADAAARRLAERLDVRLLARAGTASGAYPIDGPPAWFLVFPAETRSGRRGALALGAPEPLALSADEDQLMLRLATQAMLMLDHALLLQQIQEQEIRDPLTGVASYRRLLDMLEYELARHRSTRRWLALMLLDVEGLDGINRSYGRSYGDHILAQLARLVEETLRPIDLVARGGSHDFGVMLPETDADEAEKARDRVRERFLAMQFAGGAVGLSIGVAHARPDEGQTRHLGTDTLLRRAEVALRESKQQQREWDALPLRSPAGTRGRPAGR
jgi:diguanylate cyclase (GGDEF)-like protein